MNNKKNIFNPKVCRALLQRDNDFSQQVAAEALKTFHVDLFDAKSETVLNDFLYPLNSRFIDAYQRETLCDCVALLQLALRFQPLGSTVNKFPISFKKCKALRISICAPRTLLLKHRRLLSSGPPTEKLRCSSEHQHYRIHTTRREGSRPCDGEQRAPGHPAQWGPPRWTGWPRCPWGSGFPRPVRSRLSENRTTVSVVSSLSASLHRSSVKKWASFIDSRLLKSRIYCL